MYDISQPDTFESVVKVSSFRSLWSRILTCALQWKKEIDTKVELPNQKPLPVILCANKCDLVGDVDRKFLDSFCEANGFAGWFETSAKEDKNVAEAGKALVAKVLTHRDIFENARQARTDVFQASTAQQTRTNSDWMCC